MLSLFPIAQGSLQVLFTKENTKYNKIPNNTPPKNGCGHHPIQSLSKQNRFEGLTE